MIQSYKTKSVCVVDFGLFVEVAEKLTEYFGHVYYYFPWQASSFPRSNSKMIGAGLSNIEVIEWFWDIVDDVDLFVFPDIYLGDLQQELVAKGKRVFGSRRGDELELYRCKSKEYFRKLGLPVGKFEVVKGMDALRRYLKENKNQFIKLNVDRGDFETFEAPDYKYAEPKLDELEAKLGMKKFNKEFVVEACIDGAVETGYDGFCIDGQYPATALAGIEIKNKAYLMKVLPYSKLPKQITEFNTVIAPTLKEYQYRNFNSTEVRVTEDGTAYMIDFCARCGSPPTEIMLELIDNLPDIMWFGAEGKLIDIETKYKWAAEVLLESGWADKNWQAIQFPEKIRKQVKLRNATKINNEYYVVPQTTGIAEVGAIVAVGQTMEEVIEEAKELCEQVKGYYIETFPSALDDAVEELDKLESFGITFDE